MFVIQYKDTFDGEVISTRTKAYRAYDTALQSADTLNLRLYSEYAAQGGKRDYDTWMISTPVFYAVTEFTVVD